MFSTAFPDAVSHQVLRKPFRKIKRTAAIADGIGEDDSDDDDGGGGGGGGGAGDDTLHEDSGVIGTIVVPTATAKQQAEQQAKQQAKQTVIKNH